MDAIARLTVCRPTQLPRRIPHSIYRGFICRAFAIARPVSFDPEPTNLPCGIACRPGATLRGYWRDYDAIFVVLA